MTRPPVWVVELAGGFWAQCPDPPPPFPRDLAPALLWFPHLQIHHLPNLTLRRAAAFLADLGVPDPVGEPDRGLRGCAGSAGGTFFILLDATDDPAEQRFTLAHEVAHFLRDYDRPRRWAAARLGPKLLEVFDGERPPTPAERLAGFARGMDLRTQPHFLGRDARGRPATAVEREAEVAADRLAFELLAPFEVLDTDPAPTDRPDLVARLGSEFGLPPGPAAGYATILLPERVSPNVAWPFPKS